MKPTKHVKTHWQQVSPWIALAATLLGVICYGIQAFYIAHHVQPYMDEGTYLYKGYLFATGVYRPFQDYGVWTNKMPLSFLRPGWIQVLFGPGLRTGRYFAIVLGIGGLIGLWLLGKKLAGNWWGAILIWMVASNQVLIKYYSMGISQVIIFFLLMWTIYLVTNNKRQIWSFLIGGLFAGVLVTSRENMVLIVPLIIGYIFWQKGWKSGLAFTASFFSVFLIVHVLYWPNILQLWTVWLPWITRWISSGEIAGTTNAAGLGTPFWFPQMDSAARWMSFWEATRQMLVPFIFILVAIVFWLQRKSKIDKEKVHLVLLLIISFLILWAAHAWASLANNYCVFCYSPYLGFFIPLGLIVGVLALSEWKKQPTSALDVTLILVVIGIMVASIVYSLSNNLWLQIMHTEVPKFNGLQMENGTIQIWRLISNKFNINYSIILEDFRNFYTNVKIVVGVVLCGISLAITSGFQHWLSKKNAEHSFTKTFLLTSLTLFSLFSVAINWNEINLVNFGCGDIIASNEQVGLELQSYLQPNDLVYWDGGNSPIPLLYVKNIRIFPALLNGNNSKRVGGVENALEKIGFWNDALAAEWRQKADVLLIAGNKYEGTSYNWTIPEMGVTEPVYPCSPDSKIFILRNR